MRAAGVNRRRGADQWGAQPRSRPTCRQALPPWTGIAANATRRRKAKLRQLATETFAGKRAHAFAA